MNRADLSRLIAQIRTDRASTNWGGWHNSITGVGTSADKGTGWAYTAPRQWSIDELGGLYEGDSLAKRAVGAVVEDGLRSGFDLLFEGDSSAGAAWLKKAEGAAAGSFFETLYDVCTDARLYGGVLLVPLRPGAPDTPLTTPEPVSSVQQAEPDVAQVLEWADDPLDPRFGRPLRWHASITHGSGRQLFAEFHYTRCVEILGNSSPRRRRLLRATYRPWPPSVLYPILEALRLFRSAMAGLGVLLQDYGQGIYHVNALDAVLTTGAEGGERLSEWMAARDQLRSAVNAIVLDNGTPGKSLPEQFSRQTVTLTEISNLIDRFKELVSEATGTPITRLFGQAPSGLSTDDMSGTRSWYDQVSMWRTRRGEPTIRALVAAYGAMPDVGPAPADFEVKWPSLWQYAPAEEADSQLKVAQTDAIYLTEGVISADAIARVRAQPDGWRQDLPYEPPAEPLADVMQPPPESYDADPSAETSDRAGPPPGAPDAAPEP